MALGPLKESHERSESSGTHGSDCWGYRHHVSVGNPIAFVGHQANGEKGWFGWPADDVHEKLRDKWAAAGSVDEQKAIAREMQKHDWDFVPHVWLGQWASPVAYRKNLRGVLAIPEIIPFWNIEKV